MPSKIGERIKKQRDSLGLSQAELAKVCGWPTASRLGNYELEVRKLSADDAEILARALNVTPAFLLFGDEAINVLNEFNYPVLQAEKLLKQSVDELLTDDGIITAPSGTKAGDRAFWYEVMGHSMTAPLGMRPSFPEGILVLCDPDHAPDPGDFCLVKLISENEIAFKKFVKEDGRGWLEPLNTATRYQTIPQNDSTVIIGKIVSAAWPDTLFT